MCGDCDWNDDYHLGPPIESYKVRIKLSYGMNWVSVKDRLPPNDDDVLIFNPEDGIHFGYYDKDEVRGYIENDGSYFITNSGWTTYYEWAPKMNPTHWMPLPEEPGYYDEEDKKNIDTPNA